MPIPVEHQLLKLLVWVDDDDPLGCRSADREHNAGLVRAEVGELDSPVTRRAVQNDPTAGLDPDDDRALVIEGRIGADLVADRAQPPGVGDVADVARWAFGSYLGCHSQGSLAARGQHNVDAMLDRTESVMQPSRDRAKCVSPVDSHDERPWWNPGAAVVGGVAQGPDSSRSARYSVPRCRGDSVVPGGVRSGSSRAST